jgi:uncharacterized membrane protein
VVTLAVTESGLHGAMRILDEWLGRDDVALRSSEPGSVIRRSFTETILRGENHATWEEMELTIARESTMTINAMLVMAVAGALSAIGIAQNAVHLVIGAMVIAPGFLPITRTMIGVLAHDAAWRHGLIDFAKGYLSLIFGAGAMALVLRAAGIAPLGDDPTYLASGTLTQYWTTISFPSVTSSAVAAFAGILLVVTNRAILTSGVMIALALVPTASLIAIGAVAGDALVVIDALVRWLIDVALVAVAALAVLSWKRAKIYHGRRSALEG